ncbi:MAG: D-alanine--D-alanine ligase [Bacillota bacterium]|nr:D-alanine--D-alanine ligase [Bacillota bacterium]
MNKKIRVAVIFGGQSSEHEVSRVSAESVIRNINKDKFDVVMVGITKDGNWLNYNGPVDKLGSGEWEKLALTTRATAVENKLLGEDSSKNKLVEGASARSIFKAAGMDNDGQKIDIVFPVLHGANGEDGTIQGLFELAGIPYVGAGVLASAVGMDKAFTKIIFEKEGIPQGKYLVFNRKNIKSSLDEVINKVESVLPYPCFVKPSNAGSSVGVGKAHDRRELIETLFEAAKHDRKVLVEEFINGREVECAVLGNDDPIASTVGEVIPCNEFYDYKAKYIDNNSKVIIPADLPESTIAEIREYAVRAFKSLDCAGLSRIDFFVLKETGKVYINEINTLPGFTSISMYPKLWEASGIPYSELIEKLLDLAVERYNDKISE